MREKSCSRELVAEMKILLSSPPRPGSHFCWKSVSLLISAGSDSPDPSGVWVSAPNCSGNWQTTAADFLILWEIRNIFSACGTFQAEIVYLDSFYSSRKYSRHFLNNFSIARSFFFFLSSIPLCHENKKEKFHLKWNVFLNPIKKEYNWFNYKIYRHGINAYYSQNMPGHFFVAGLKLFR